jgi:hypothetical protein
VRQVMARHRHDQPPARGELRQPRRGHVPHSLGLLPYFGASTSAFPQLKWPRRRALRTQQVCRKGPLINQRDRQVRTSSRQTGMVAPRDQRLRSVMVRSPAASEFADVSATGQWASGRSCRSPPGRLLTPGFRAGADDRGECAAVPVRSAVLGGQCAPFVCSQLVSRGAYVAGRCSVYGAVLGFMPLGLAVPGRGWRGRW